MAKERDKPALEQRLVSVRGEIDATDDEILRLLNQRARAVAEVADLKAALEVPFYVPSRERQIAERLSAQNTGPFPTEAIRSVFQEIFSACLSLEKSVRVAYLGPEGTFSHMAVKRQFGLSARSTTGNVAVTSVAVTTSGKASTGISAVAQHGNAAVTSTGAVKTSGDNSDGIFASGTGTVRMIS